MTSTKRTPAKPAELWRGETETKYVLSSYGPSKPAIAKALYKAAKEMYDGDGYDWSGEYCPTLKDFTDDYVRFELVSPAGVVQCDGNYDYALDHGWEIKSY